jgi:hypothetical protein
MAEHRASDMPTDEQVVALLASTYKLMKWMDKSFKENRPFFVLDKVRWMIDERPMQMDGVSYSEMREYIRDFMERRLHEPTPKGEDY